VFPVCSEHSSERLETEKEELRVALQEQHQKDLVELEQRLQAFYQAEWDKLHLACQEEADKCKTLMQQQVGPRLPLTLSYHLIIYIGRFIIASYYPEINTKHPQNDVHPVFFFKVGELNANHEAMKLELESSQAEHLLSVKQQYDASLEGERTVFHQINETTSIAFYESI